MPESFVSQIVTPCRTIDEVIAAMDVIVAECSRTESNLGYFAILYRRVTIQVKEGIAAGFFDDGARMEELDVIFANRYLEAWHKRENGQSDMTESWRVAFERSTWYWPIVLQHLLLGMNAHINLDLGIAAAEIMQGKDIHALERDFNRINDILNSLVEEVQNGLAAIWPRLHKLLRWSGNLDNHLSDFSMQLARNGAWKFAVHWHALPEEARAHSLSERDRIVQAKADLILPKNIWLRLAFLLIRLGERGSISEKMDALHNPSVSLRTQ